MTLAATVKASINASQSTTGDLGTGKFDINPAIAQAFVNGAGAGAVDRMFSDTRTLAASANENLDPATGGGLTDCFGAALALARIKVIFIKASASNTNDVILSRPASNGVPIFNAASDAVNIKPGGCILLMAPDATGYPVTAATADLINLANSGAGTSVTYDIVILGSAT
jgi:hypothetical protein